MPYDPDKFSTWTSGQPCPHKVGNSCRLAAAIAFVSKQFAGVTDDQCAECLRGAEPTREQPNRIVAQIANKARDGSAIIPAIVPVKYNPIELPCVHRSPEPTGTITCRPCQNAGFDKLRIHDCAVHGKCAIRGYSMEVAHICLTCEQRKPPDNKAQPAQNPEQAPVVRVKSMVYNRHDDPADHLADQFHGASCILACGGPSLAEMDLSPLSQRGVFVAAISQVAATHIRPQAWFSVDQCKTYHAAIWRDPAIMKFVARQHRHKGDEARVPLNIKGEWTLDELTSQCPNVWYYQRGDEWDLQSFLDRPYAMWRTTEEVGKDRGKKSVMLVALRLLYWLGFRSVFIIGADFLMQTHRQYAFAATKGERACRSNNKAYDALNIAFHRLRPILESRGMNVYNATTGGRLTAFDRVPFSEAVNSCRARFPKTIDVTGLYH